MIYKICFLIILFSLHNPLEAKSNLLKYNLSICSVFKDEGEFLEEWIEYHRLLGVDHFYLYDYGSTDDFKEVLQPYIQEGIVTLVFWPITSLFEDKALLWSLGVQIAAYENALLLRCKETNWLVFLDIDEFLVPAQANTLPELLHMYQDKPGITVSSQCFNGITDSRRNLVIENILLVDAPKSKPEKEVSKTLFKPALCDGFTWPPYRCSFKQNQHPIRISSRELRINKYINRSADVSTFPSRKIAFDSLLNEQYTAELLSQGYQIEDQEQSIQRFVPTLLQKMALRLKSGELKF